MYTQVRAEWDKVPDSLNYVCKRTGYIAIYVSTVDHWGNYNIFRRDGTLWRTGQLPRMIHM